MGTFVTGNTALPTPKTDASPPQGLSSELDAADINSIWVALDDVRKHVVGPVNVMEYGADATGATDSSAAIVAADAAAVVSGRAVFLPAGTYKISNNVTTASMLWFWSNAALSVDSGKTFTSNGRVIALGGDPKVGAGAIVYGKDTNLFCNDSGFSFSKTPSTGTDDFFHIRRDIQGSTGIIVRNDDDVGALTDSYIHLYGGPLTGGTQGSNLRFSAGNLANNNGLCNIVAQNCAAFSLINLASTPLDLYTAGVRQLQIASVASSVNYWQFKGGAAASSVSVAPAGTDTNISATFFTKGTGSVFFRTGISAGFQVEIKDTASATARLTLTGSNGGNPTISASAGAVAFGKATVQTRVVLTYSATIATDASLGNIFSISPTNGTAFTISDPTNLSAGQLVRYVIRNISGGALGAITWGTTLFKMPTFTAPATGFSRTVEFMYDGANLIQQWQSAADVPN